MSIAGTNFALGPSQKPIFFCRYTPEPGNWCSGESVAKRIMSMSSFSSPAFLMAISAAGTARSEEPTPSSAYRRSSMPVRWRIHSWVVSIPYWVRRSSFVTTRGGTYIPVPET
jgi:hypothetical protein